MLKDSPIYCPACDGPIGVLDIDWEQHRARCGPCDIELPLIGYLEVPASHPELDDIVARNFRPIDMSQPSGLKLKKTALPGVESFRVGGTLASVKIRLEKENLIIKGLFGRESAIPMDRVIGFAALQHVTYIGSPGATPGDVNWHVVAALDGGTMVRIWEYEQRDHARYVVSEINKVLGRIRSPKTPYRD